MHTTSTLQEVVFAAHFQQPADLSVLDLASWAAMFETEFPHLQQLPPLDPVAFLAQQQQLTVNFGPSAQLPRLLKMSHDQRYTLQIQNDRLAFGWRRLEPVGVITDYPGYDVLKDRWDSLATQFREWWGGRFQTEPVLRLVELNYANAMPIGARLSEVFRFVHPVSSRPLVAFQASWTEVSGDVPNSRVSILSGV